jgi:hypothetical protein
MPKKYDPIPGVDFSFFQQLCKGAFATDRMRKPVSEQSPAACSWCLLGALRRALFNMDSEKYQTAYERIRKAIIYLFPSRTYPPFLISFSDHPDTTTEDVHKVLKYAGLMPDNSESAI